MVVIRTTVFLTLEPKMLTSKYTNVDFTLTYQFPAFATEIRNTKHISYHTGKLIIFFLLKWNKNQTVKEPTKLGVTNHGQK